MSSRRMPLFPSACSSGSSLQMPLFGGCDCGCRREECQTVRVRNPACPEEYADVELCVDADGNLSICVHRPPRPCMPPRHRCGCNPCTYR